MNTTEIRAKSNPLCLYSGGDEWIQGIRSGRLPEELGIKVCNIVQEVVAKTISKKKKRKLRKEEMQKPKEKGNTQLNAEFQKIARRDKKVLSEQCKEIEEK